MNAATSLLQTAVEAGAELCLANPGTTEMPLVAALDAVDGMRSVLCLFEGVATGAADGYGRMTGRPALTLLHLGPGFANGIANLHNARRARSPVVNLIGDHASWHLQHDAPLTSDIVSLASPVSDWLRSCESGRALPHDMAAAWAAATGPPGRVASLIVPADHQAAESGGPAPLPRAESRASADDERVEAAARLLRGAVDAGDSRVTLLLGGAALSARGLRAAGRIANATGVRLVSETFPARWERGAGLPVALRLPYLPEQASGLLAGQHALLLAGAREPVSFFGYEGVPSRIAGDVPKQLLAEPEQDVEAALEDLADAVPAAGQNAEPPPTGPEPHVPANAPLSPVTVGAVLAAHLPEDAIVVDEAATSGLAFYSASERGPRHTLLTLTGGAIGQGLPCATGAALACPERRVIAFQADGSAAYTFQALWTRAREGLDVTTLLCSNRAYRILQIELARAGVTEPGPNARSLTRLDEPDIDWVALARGCGVPGRRVESAGELAQALGRALAEPGPRLLELVLG